MCLKLFQLRQRACCFLLHQCPKAGFLLIIQLVQCHAAFLLQGINPVKHLLHLLLSNPQHISTVNLQTQIQHLIKIGLAYLAALSFQLRLQLLPFLLSQGIELLHQLGMALDGLQAVLLLRRLLKKCLIRLCGRKLRLHLRQGQGCLQAAHLLLE